VAVVAVHLLLVATEILAHKLVVTAVLELHHPIQDHQSPMQVAVVEQDTAVVELAVLAVVVTAVTAIHE
jgi:hypothetical protein